MTTPPPDDPALTETLTAAFAAVLAPYLNDTRQRDHLAEYLTGHLLGSLDLAGLQITRRPTREDPR